MAFNTGVVDLADSAVPTMHTLTKNTTKYTEKEFFLPGAAGSKTILLSVGVEFEICLFLLFKLFFVNSFPSSLFTHLRVCRSYSLA